eukprot:g4821.t1
MLLPLRPPDERAARRSVARSPYEQDERELFDLLEESIHFKEHRARKKRSLQNNTKAHIAYMARLNADKMAELKLKAAKSVESSAAFIAASKTATKKKAVGLDGESDEDEADSDNQSEVEDMKAGEGKAGGKEEGKGPDASGDLNEDDGGRGGAKKRIDPPAIKMDEETAKTLLQGILGKYARTAINLLFEAIRKKNADMVSAVLTTLCPIGRMPEKEKPVGPTAEQLEKANSAENQALLARFKPPTPRDEPEPPATQNILQKMGPLLDVNSTSAVGLSPLHVAAGAGDVKTLKVLVEAWGADLHRRADDGYEDYGYSVFQHALNAVSKGLSDEKCLDWLQIHGANAELNPKSRIGRHTANFIAMKEAKEAKKEQAKLDAKKAKVRARRKNRAKKAKKKSVKK